MHNIVYLLGRITDIKTIEEKEIIVTLAVQKTTFKDGKYEINLIPCVLYNNMAIHTKKYCCEGDLIGIKGSLEIDDNNMVVVADKVSFLSSKRTEEGK